MALLTVCDSNLCPIQPTSLQAPTAQPFSPPSLCHSDEHSASCKVALLAPKWFPVPENAADEITGL